MFACRSCVSLQAPHGRTQTSRAPPPREVRVVVTRDVRAREGQFSFALFKEQLPDTLPVDDSHRIVLDRLFDPGSSNVHADVAFCDKSPPVGTWEGQMLRARTQREL